jgi:uncharacterized membrane protein
MYLTKKIHKMLLFNFIFDFLWAGRGSSVNFVAFIRFLELKCVEKHGSRRIDSANNLSHGNRQQIDIRTA